jgi:hypothetical protein
VDQETRAIERVVGESLPSEELEEVERAVKDHMKLGLRALNHGKSEWKAFGED